MHTKTSKGGIYQKSSADTNDTGFIKDNRKQKYIINGYVVSLVARADTISLCS